MVVLAVQNDIERRMAIAHEPMGLSSGTPKGGGQNKLQVTWMLWPLPILSYCHAWHDAVLLWLPSNEAIRPSRFHHMSRKKNVRYNHLWGRG